VGGQAGLEGLVVMDWARLGPGEHQGGSFLAEVGG